MATMTFCVSVQLTLPNTVSNKVKFALDAIDLINLDLQRAGLISEPQIITNSLNEETIIIQNDETEDI